MNFIGKTQNMYVNYVYVYMYICIVGHIFLSSESRTTLKKEIRRIQIAKCLKQNYLGFWNQLNVWISGLHRNMYYLIPFNRYMYINCQSLC